MLRTERMKILVLTNLYPPQLAGTDDFRCQNLTEALRLRGHTMRVLTSKHGLNREQRGGEVERRLQLQGVYDHPAVTSFGELRALEQANHQALREAVAEFQPDLIHVYSLTGLSKSLVFSLRNVRLPVVYDVADDWLIHGLREDPWLRWWNQPGGSLLRQLHRAAREALGQRNQLDATAPTRMMKGYERLPRLYARSADAGPAEPVTGFQFDRLYFCSQALKADAEQAGFRVGHAEVIYPGIPAQNFVADIKPASAPVSKLLLVARLEARSGARTAVQALQRLREASVPVTLSIYGRGDSEYLAEIRSLVARHQLPVEFLNVSNLHKDLPAVYRRHDALLQTAEWNEPFATTPLEAMASGLPVIGTTLGGVHELLRHGENAFTYPPGDAQALASRIQEVQQQPALRAQVAETAQQEVLSKFNETAVADRVEDYLQISLETWAHSEG
jgi:glycogen synthase